jgi:hypothetical protein
LFGGLVHFGDYRLVFRDEVPDLTPRFVFAFGVGDAR